MFIKNEQDISNVITIENEFKMKIYSFIQLSFFIALAFLFLQTNQLSAQVEFFSDSIEHWPSSHQFKGKVFAGSKTAENVLIKVFEDNTCISTYTTKKNGKFVFIAESEKYYTLQFEKVGFVTKRVIIKTNNTGELDYFTKNYKFDISLEKEMENIDYSLHDFPVALIQIGNKLKKFEFNRKYTFNRKKEIELNLKEQMAKK